MSKSTTALVLGDLQNDFIHPQGAYGKAGQSDPAIAALPARLAPLVRVARERDQASDGDSEGEGLVALLSCQLVGPSGSASEENGRTSSRKQR